MTVKSIISSLGLKVYTQVSDREVSYIYCCDLLSNALVKLEQNALWITVMNNVNVAAIAYNVNAACVVLAEGVKPDAELVLRAKEHGVCILGSELNIYETALGINALQKT